MRSVVLPLYNTQGKPYWYVMTDKMVAASEVLCEEAMKQEEFDPYQMEMTTAMTWEMFFTSFVEGSQIDMDEALDYLSTDSEPESIQEQLLWNNRQALSAATNGIYHPVDEAFLGHLAYLLTQEMDGTATAYRQSDTHLIPAMTDEVYTVPVSSDIPDRMNDLYNFLGKTDTHPLIKAAVSQAYLLMVRPFPDGNERLSRILSTLILYRSGYDYFRDISISKKIARESYRYYKNMKEILNSENDADITCFVEYYLDLLSRALQDHKKELERHDSSDVDHEETLQNERRMALQPLSSGKGNEEKADDLPPKNMADIADVLAGANTISMPTPTERPEQQNTSQAVENIKSRYWKVVNRYCNSDSKNLRHNGEIIKRLLDKGVDHFTVAEWAEYAQVSPEEAKTSCYNMRKHGVLYNINNSSSAVYRFTLYKEPYNDKTYEKPLPVTAESEPMNIVESGAIDSSDKERIRELSTSSNSRDRRIAQTLINFINRGQFVFSSHEWADECGISSSTSDKELRDIIGMGLVHRTGNEKRYFYHIGRSPNGDTGMQLSRKQEEIRDMIADRGFETFTQAQVAELTGLRDNTINYHFRYMLCCNAIEAIPNTTPTKYKLINGMATQRKQHSGITTVTVYNPSNYPMVASGAERVAMQV